MGDGVSNSVYRSLIVIVCYFLFYGFFCQIKRCYLSETFECLIFLQVGLSLFVSNVGNATFIGIAGAASSRGFPVVAYEFSVCMILSVEKYSIEQLIHV